MSSAIIGATGFVGSNLLLQYPESRTFNSRNIEEIRNCHFETIYCAGIQAKKWWANQNDAEDLSGIQKLLNALETVSCDQFVLISTVDVYPTPKNVDEDSSIDAANNHAYGRNRYFAEEFVRRQFPEHLILRLPGLFGSGLKKNVIHDFIHRHEVEKINPLGVYQYYGLGQLRNDIEQAQKRGIKLLNLATEPLATSEIHQRYFADRPLGLPTEFVASYDMHTKYASDWDSASSNYLYDKTAVLAQLEDFLSKEGVIS